MKFGVRECADVVLKAKYPQKIGNKTFFAGEPVCYFDTLKTSTFEGSATTVYAQGGRGNARLMSWDGERTVTFTMEDALISPAGLAILTGAGLVEASNDNRIYQHVTEQVTGLKSGLGTSTFTYEGYNETEYQTGASAMVLSFKRAGTDDPTGSAVSSYSPFLIEYLKWLVGQMSASIIAEGSGDNITYSLSEEDDTDPDDVTVSEFFGKDAYTVLNIGSGTGLATVNDKRYKIKAENYHHYERYKLTDVDIYKKVDSSGTGPVTTMQAKVGTKSLNASNLFVRLKPLNSYIYVNYRDVFDFANTGEDLDDDDSISVKLQTLTIKDSFKTLLKKSCVFAKSNAFGSRVVDGEKKPYADDLSKLTFKDWFLDSDLNDDGTIKYLYAISSAEMERTNEDAPFVLTAFKGLFEYDPSNKLKGTRYKKSTRQAYYCTLDIKQPPVEVVTKDSRGNFIRSENANPTIMVMALNNHGEVISEPYYFCTGVNDLQRDGIPTANKNGLYTIGLSTNIYNNTPYTIPSWSNDRFTEFRNAPAYLVDYYTAKTSGALQIEITPDKFGGTYYLEASTLWRDQATGQDLPAEFVIPNCKVQSNFSFTLASSGDPSSFTFTMDAFPDYTKWDLTKKVIAAIQVIGGSIDTEEVHRETTWTGLDVYWDDSGRYQGSKTAPDEIVPILED